MKSNAAQYVKSHLIIPNGMKVRTRSTNPVLNALLRMARACLL